MITICHPDRSHK